MYLHLQESHILVLTELYLLFYVVPRGPGNFSGKFGLYKKAWNDLLNILFSFTQGLSTNGFTLKRETKDVFMYATY